MRHRKLVGAALLLALPGIAPAADVSVIGLMNGKAVLSINGGKPRMLSAGETSPEGVKLVTAGTDSAVVEFGGRRQTLVPGQGTRVGTATGSGPAQVTLTADVRGHFQTTGTINGVSVRFLVDTGATSIAMSGNEAKRLGINYLSAPRALSQTANGVVPVYTVKLDTVRIGDITANNVDAIVIDGNVLPVVLLGMSFLNRMEMKREGVSMTLIKRH